jgi:hypothetical protein
MVRSVPSAKARFLAEVNQAKKFAEMLAPGSHAITSKRGEGGYNRQSESTNWFYAIGGYTSWGRGTVLVSPGARKEFRLEFEYRFYDRYNWDTGKQVTIAGITITDQFMGEFHRQGIAQEFDCVGTMKHTFTWKQGDPIGPAQLAIPGGR